MEEKDLIKKAKSDPDAFGELYEKYYPQIFGYILKRTAKIEITQDITSEVFSKALKNIWQFRWQNVPFGAWLYRIANNEIANYFRRNKYKIVSIEKIPELTANSDILEEILEAEKELENHQDFLLAQQHISSLSVKYQEVISLRFFDKKKINEIAQILNKKEGTVKSLLSRGLDQLRNSMA